MKTLKIALYYPWIYLKGGVERSMAALITRSRHDWTIFTHRFEPENTFADFGQFKVVQIETISVRRNMAEVMKATWRILTTRLPLDEFDAYVVWCDGLGPLTLFRNHAIPSFCICSTPLRAVYDPAYAREALRRRRLLANLAFFGLRGLFHQVDRLAWSYFDGVVATSREVQERIVNHHLYPPDRRMILRHPGIDLADAPVAVTHEPFFLVPGRIAWTKNLQLAIEAFIASGLGSPWRLVIAGFIDSKSHTYFAELKQRVAGHRGIEFIENPSDEHLNHLYRTTYAVLFPPLNEDWGIAVLEGMLRAKPVVANASGGPLESVHDGVSGWLLPPKVAPWAERLRQLAAQPELVYLCGRLARQKVEAYDWKHFVAGVDNLVEAGVNRRLVPSTEAVAPCHIPLAPT